jgi:hypothetical protein
MKTKRFLIFILFLIPLIFISTIKVSADTGPKPKIYIEIENKMEGSYIALISENRGWGPYSINEKSDTYWTDEEKLIDSKFSEYADKDNYYYVHVFGDISDGSYIWHYMPPKDFKILIYDSINDRIITNDIKYTTYAFSSYYKLTFNNDNFNVVEDYHYGHEVGSFFLRLAICLLIEIGIALIFKFFGKKLIFIIITNVITQVLLNIALNIYCYYNGLGFFAYRLYITLEVAILLFEFVAYLFAFNVIPQEKEKQFDSKLKILLYTAIANASSFVGGWIILSTFGM